MRSPRKEMLLVSLTALFIIACPFSRADGIILGTNQTDYYFLVGEDAGFLIDVSNPFNESVTGQFSFTLSQQQKTGNMMTQSSNSQSKSLKIDPGSASLVFDLGPQQNVGEHVFKSAKLDYTGPDGVSRIVSLEDITIHIIDNPDKKKQSNPGKSQSQTAQEAAEQEKKAQEAADKQKEEDLKRRMQQQQEASKIQNKVQNNQMNQNTGALKNEMQKQVKQETQAQDMMKKILQQDSKFQKMAKSLMDQGFNITDSEMNPSGNDSGDFKVNFENTKGDKASIDGVTKEGKVKNLSVSKELSLQSMMEKLKDNPDFQKYDSTLSSEGFAQGEPSLQGSDLILDYYDKKNESARITAVFNQTEIEEVNLKRNRSYWPYFIPLVILAGLIAILVLRKKEDSPEPAAAPPIDYRKEAEKMIMLSKTLYKEGKAKDAYGKAGEAVRFFMSYDLELERQLTNNQLLREMRKKKLDTSQVAAGLSLCSLVEFAKYKPNDKDFGKIIDTATKIIS